jgi:flagellar hook-associated protein 3 FlgL
MRPICARDPCNRPGAVSTSPSRGRNLDGAQTNILAAQASLGSSLATIQGVAAASSTQSTNAAAQLSNLQSADLPQVLANYSASVTALQASDQAFAKISNLSLFSLIK